MRRPRFRTHDDRVRQEYARLIAEAWDGLSSSLRSDLICERPELYFAIAVLARHEQTSGWRHA